MAWEKIERWFIFFMVSAMLAVTSCQDIKTVPAEKTQKSAKMALKFTPRTKTTYKSTVMSQMSLDFKGTVASDPSFKNSKNQDRTEMVFTQEILSVNEQGEALVKVMIDSVKFTSIFKNETKLDADSSREADKDSPFAKLVGQSYNITLSPSGQVKAVADTAQALTAVSGTSAASEAAEKLLDPNVIKERHSIWALPDKPDVRRGDNWSNTKSYNFPILGQRSFERVYTLDEIKSGGDRQTASVTMKAIPSAAVKPVEGQQAASVMTNMFDSTETLTGTMDLNLTSGRVEKYCEKLESQWLVVDPAIKTTDNKGPDTITMGAVRLRSLEEIK